jgi:protein O-GlcNAc transferase
MTISRSIMAASLLFDGGEAVAGTRRGFQGGNWHDGIAEARRRRYGPGRIAADGASLTAPGTLETLLNEAMGLHHQGRLEAAEAGYQAVLARYPGELNAQHLLGVLRQQQGRAADSAALIAPVLAALPDNAVIRNNYGNALKSLGRTSEALACYRRAAELSPGFADARLNLGRLLLQMGAAADAVACFETVLALEPPSPAVLNDLGRACQSLGRLAEAIRHFRGAVALAPDQAALHGNLGLALKQAGDPTGAAKALERAADSALAGSLGSSDADLATLNAIGMALLDLGLAERAAALLGHAATRFPDRPELRINLGNALNRLGQTEAALAAYRQALHLDPRSADAHNNLAALLASQGQREAAIAEYRHALALRPNYIDALVNLGNALFLDKRFEQAADCYGRAVALDPNHPIAAAGLVGARRFACDWRDFPGDLARLAQLVEIRASGIDPFVALAFPLAPALLRRAAETAVAHNFGAIATLPPRPRQRADRPIRVAYLSANYNNHAMASLMVEMIESHDRAAFEIWGISFGGDDGSALRQRLAAAFDHFLDVRADGDAAVARRLAEAEIDIAVDLMGHTLGHRLGILAYRPAPVQVSFLGCPGTTGASFIDYVIGDQVVLPRDQQPFWSEQIVHLPFCYQANDSKRQVPVPRPSRAECGLPAEGFVFCCFNNNYKITLEVFACWLRLLDAVPDSVLWLLRDNDDAVRRLRDAAAASGLDPARLIFAPIVSHQFHLARQTQADLFLDTNPYNAHTTASDALRMGLPMVTWLGDTFPARVAASLLLALDLPELIASDLASYETLALTLVQNPVFFAEIRQKLQQNAATSALFDGKRFCRGIEAVYRRMLAHWLAGTPPQGFAL